MGNETAWTYLRNFHKMIENKFNIREGLSRKDDTLPPRLLNEPLTDGMAAGKKVEGLDLMLDDYYAIRGGDKNGLPLN